MARACLLMVSGLIIPALCTAQAELPDSCGEPVSVTAGPLWVGVTPRAVSIHVGPGPEYEPHESGELIAGEEVQIIAECGDWLRGRVIPPNLIQQVIQANGLERATQMLLFWVHRNAIRPVGVEDRIE